MRPHLKRYVQLWSPCSASEIMQIQQKDPERVKGLEHMTLEERKGDKCPLPTRDLDGKKRYTHFRGPSSMPGQEEKGIPQRKFLLNIK